MPTCRFYVEDNTVKVKPQLAKSPHSRNSFGRTRVMIDRLIGLLKYLRWPVVIVLACLVIIAGMDWLREFILEHRGYLPW